MLTDTGIGRQYFELLVESLDIPPSLYERAAEPPPFARRMAVPRRIAPSGVQPPRVTAGLVPARHRRQAARRGRGL